MNHPHLDQAREWAKGVHPGHHPEAVATAKVIASLPDQWVDVKKVREALEGCDKMTYPYEVMAHIEKTLLTPPLPTLAELIPEEREACQWMQAISDPDSGYTDGPVVIVQVQDDRSILMWEDGSFDTRHHQHITPLPDLPKLEWPGSHADTITAESVDDMQASRVADFEPALPRPEDVPEGEPWIVQHEDREWVGCRNDPGTRLPWLVIRRDESQFDYCYDTDITLVSRLVRETP